MAILAQLEKIFNSKQMKSDPESLAHYGRDWTTYYDIKPSAVVFPESTEQVQALVKMACQNKIGLVPSGGRTGLSGAACATNFEVVVSFERMNKIFNFNPIAQTVDCQAGVITEHLQDFAKAQGLHYPVDFAARGSAQLGGNIATNAGGIKVVRYGMTRDWITGLTVVTGSGEILKLNQGLVKNATGYDLRHLFIGSEGTLGFILEATVQLAPPPPPLQVMVLGLSDLAAVMKVFGEFKRRTSLTAFEMFADNALTKVLASTGLPRPFATVCPFYAVVEVEMPTEQDQEKCLEVFDHCLNQGWVRDGSQSQSELQAKMFWRLREDISESLAKFSPYKNDVSVEVSLVSQFLDELDHILAKAYPSWEVVWFGHVGDGNLHINILRPPGLSKEDFVRDCRQVDELVFSCVRKYHGAISAEHGVGLSKKSFLQYSRSPAEIQLMKGIKAVFDPYQIMNPGKVFEN